MIAASGGIVSSCDGDSTESDHPKSFAIRLARVRGARQRTVRNPDTFALRIDPSVVSSDRPMTGRNELVELTRTIFRGAECAR